MPEAPVRLKDIPEVTDLGHEEQMFPYKVSEQAGQALDKPVKPEEFQGRDWSTTVSGSNPNPPANNTGFEKGLYQTTVTTPDSYTTNHPSWWTRLMKGWALSKEKGGYWFKTRLKEVGRRGQTLKNG